VIGYTDRGGSVILLDGSTSGAQNPTVVRQVSDRTLV